MKKTLEVLNELVTENIIEGYALGGAVAAIFYIEPIDTSDLDVWVVLKQAGLLISLTPIFSALSERGYDEFEDGGIIIEGIPVQFLPVATSLQTETYEQARTEFIRGVPCHIPTLEHLMAIMLDIGRPKDQLRLLMCLESPTFNFQAFIPILKRHQLEEKWKLFCSKNQIEINS